MLKTFSNSQKLDKKEGRKKKFMSSSEKTKQVKERKLSVASGA